MNKAAVMAGKRARRPATKAIAVILIAVGVVRSVNALVPDIFFIRCVSWYEWLTRRFSPHKEVT